MNGNAMMMQTYCIVISSSIVHVTIVHQRLKHIYLNVQLSAGTAAKNDDKRRKRREAIHFHRSSLPGQLRAAVFTNTGSCTCVRGSARWRLLAGAICTQPVNLRVANVFAVCTFTHGCTRALLANIRLIWLRYFKKVFLLLISVMFRLY